MLSISLHAVCGNHENGTASAAKSLQSCLTLCDPIDGSPPGSSVPGILQARILESGCHFLLQYMLATIYYTITSLQPSSWSELLYHLVDEETETQEFIAAEPQFKFRACGHKASSLNHEYPNYIS